MGKILAICISEKKGTQKKPIESARLVEEWGIEGDAHVGKWHRQVSMLSFEKIEAFREKGADVDFGAFGENLVVEGFDLSKVPVGTKFQIGEAILELTQIGKECHSHCAIYKVMGDCIMPREGVFTRVLKGGEIKMARGKAAALIESGRVQLNWRACTKPDRTVSEGDTVSARGFGKFELTEVGALTKKGRIPITVQCYK